MAEGLVGRDHVVALVAGLVERPRSDDPPLPIVVLAGPGGSGKTHLLDHLERASHPDLPYARVNLSRDPNATSCRVVLDVVYQQLRRYDHPQFGRLRLHRYELGRMMRSQVPPDGEAGDPTRTDRYALAGFIRLLRHRWKVPTEQQVLSTSVPGRALRLALDWLLRLMVPGSLVVRRGPLRRLLWGRRYDAAMGWYESQAPRMRLPVGARIGQIGGWFGRPPTDGHGTGEDDRALADALLLDALLEDLRENYLRGRDRRYRTGYCLLLIDDADLLPTAAGQNFLRLLADRRRALLWDPLVVVATKQGGLDEEIGGGPATTAPPAPPVPAPPAPGVATDRQGWLERYRQDEDPNPYLPVRLHRLTTEQTRQLVTDLVSSPTADESGLALSEEMYQVSRGHPLAVRLLTEALHAEHVRWPARELPSVRSRLNQPMAVPPPDALPRETVEEYLLRRMLQRVTQPGEYQRLPDEYQRLSDELRWCGAARRLDTDIVRMLVTARHQPDATRRALAERWLDRVADSSFVEAIHGDTVVFHPLLGDLLAARLVATGTGEESSYRRVHGHLRDYFEPLSRTGDEIALGEYLYHCLALDDVRPLVDRLAPVLTDRTIRTRERWLRLLRSVTEAPMPGRPPPLPVDPHPIRGLLRDLLSADRPRRDAGSALAQAVQYLRAIRSCTSEERWDEPLLDGALRAVRALPGADRRDSLARDLGRELADVLRHATGEPLREPLPARSELAAPDYRMALRRVRPSRRTRRRAALAALLAPCLALAGLFGVGYYDLRRHACAATGTLPVLRGSGADDYRVITRVAGQCVGITDGSFTFSTFAAPYERRILRQNREVASLAEHGRQVVTVVVTAMLTSDDKVSPQKDIGSGVNELEGAYLAQWRYDTGGNSLARAPDPLLRVLIANLGGKSRQAELAARKVVDLARHEPIVAVTGLPQTRPETLAAVRLLGAAGIPMVASVTSGDVFHGLDHFFRVAPSNDQEAAALAAFARSRFAGRSVWLLGDNGDEYSRNLSNDLARRLGESGMDFTSLPYTAESRETNDQIQLDVLRACMRPASADPLIFYTGRANELGTVFAALTDPRSPCPHATVLAGDDLSSLQAPPNEGFPSSANKRLFFVSFGLGESDWQAVHHSGTPPPFYADHARFFGKDEVNGHVIAAYDAAGAVISAIRSTKSEHPSAAAVYRMLHRMHGASAYQGVGGTLSFDGAGEPRGRLVVIDEVTDRGARFRTSLGTP